MLNDAEEVLASQYRRLIELREKRDEAKVTLKNAEQEYRECDAELYEEMEHGPFKGSRKIDLGGAHGVVTFTPRATPYGRIIDREAAVAYFEEQGELHTMIEDKVIARRLNELVKERLEAGASLPPGVDFYYRRAVAISRK